MNVMPDYAGGYGIAFSTTRSTYGHDGGSAPYVSALYAAAILDQTGSDVEIIDSHAEQLSDCEALERVLRFDPKIIISVVSLPSMTGDLAFLGMLRRHLPDAEVIAIGTTCKLLYPDVLESGAIHAAVRGDVEVVIPPLVGVLSDGRDLSSVPGIAYKDADGSTHVTDDSEPLRSLNDLPMLPYHKLPMHQYREPSWGPGVRYMSILDGRGCPYPCRGYCPYPFGFGRRTLLRNPSLVVDEIQHLAENFGTEAFIFRNQVFTMYRNHAERICQEILNRKLNIRWLCETRLDSVDAEILALMRSAGCERIHYGLESGDPEMFSDVGKPGCDLAKLGRLVSETKKAGITAKLNVVIGLPGESWQTVQNTIRTIRELRPDAVMAAIITPYPGTAIFEDAKLRGLLLTNDWSQFTGFTPVMCTERLTPDDLLKARKMVENCLDDATFPARAARKALRLVRGR
jgi:radical SAM superfamily enzyme YgiQ (UPF0313 family)